MAEVAATRCMCIKQACPYTLRFGVIFDHGSMEGMSKAGSLVIWTTLNDWMKSRTAAGLV